MRPARDRERGWLTSDCPECLNDSVVLCLRRIIKMKCAASNFDIGSVLDIVIAHIAKVEAEVDADVTEREKSQEYFLQKVKEEGSLALHGLLKGVWARRDDERRTKEKWTEKESTERESRTKVVVAADTCH